MERSSTEEIKEKLPVEEVVGQYVKLVKAGKDFKGLCPFHGEKTPSFFVSPDKNVWHCFGCGKGGDIFTFVEEIEGLEFRDVLQLLADKAGVELRSESSEDSGRRKQVLDVLERSANFYRETLRQEKSDSRVWKYLKERGVTRDLADEFGLGLAPDGWSALVDYLSKEKIDPSLVAEAGLSIARDDRHYDRFRGRIMFPIQNVQGSTIGFSGRILPWVEQAEEKKGRTPGKYINTPATAVYDKSRSIYGISQARHAIRKSDVALLVEGQLDVLLCHKVGFRQAVAVSGTAFTEDHARILRRYSQKVIVLFDMDDAGEKAARRAFAVASRAGIDVKIGALSSGKDPADIAQEDPAKLGKVLEEASDALSFFLDRAIEHNDITTARGKRIVMSEVMPLLASLGSAIERSHWATSLGHRLNVSETSILEELEGFMSSDRTFSQEAPEEPSVEDNKGVRSRRMLLEEHLCGLILQYPILVERLDNDVIDIFTIRSLRAIMEVVLNEQPKSLADVQGGLSSNVGTYAARLAFQIEKRIPDSDSAEREFLFLYGDLNRAHLRELLQEMVSAMRLAETNGDPERLAELQSEFTDISQQLSQFE